ncbi:hypothetical protein [Bradyrhizobium prioriisuperbiae]|uniref:hypothetical protein n=1 Tax=Bradyrhizobium prioriisuperbiae TaxID=2854389 RepID=UPI0028E3720C|nr:hypothetical protein [Bradyrhizobium prioritasuperba]
MTDAAIMLKEFSQPWRPGEFVKDVIARIAPHVGLSPTRAGDIWYGKARRIEADELARIAGALSKKRKAAVWNAIHQMEIEIARLKAVIDGSDEDFGQPIAAGDSARLRVVSETRRSASGGS